MISGKNGVRATRARDAQTLLAAALIALALAHVGARALTKVRVETNASQATQENTKAAAASAMVGAWQAATPTGLRVATLTIVPSGEGFAGSFVGYDYDRPVDFNRPSEGPPPKVAIRSGAILTDVKVEGDKLTFKMYLRPSTPPPGRPAGFDVTGEIRFQGGDAAELRLSAPGKPEPMVLKLVRE